MINQPPKRFEVLCSNIKEIAKDTYEFYFLYQEEVDFDPVPGQFCMLFLPIDGKNIPRAYSILKNNEKGIVLCIKVLKDGIATPWMKEKLLGKKITVMGPLGEFALPNLSRSDEITMVCTGTGIAPFINMLRNEKYEIKSKKINLWMGFRNKEDIIYIDELIKARSYYKGFDYYITLSGGDRDWDGFRGRVTDQLSYMNLDSYFLLCGNGEMIDEMKKMLQLKGVESNKIINEKYF